MLRRFLVVACAVLGATSVAQEADLALVIRAHDTGSPLAGAEVDILGVQGAVDAFGQAQLSGVPVGDVPISVTYPGYVRLDTTVVVQEGDANLTVLSLRSALGDARDLGDVVVEAETVNDAVLRRRGFFDRRDRLTGVFYTREELDDRGVRQVSDIFGSTPGVRIQRSGVQERLVSDRRGGCPMTVYVDGTEMAFIAYNIDALPFDDIAAVEVYRGPSELPIEYASTKFNDTCGAVLVWTRIVASND
ncbi:TonB-dependent receptor plug domain-containing protein [Rubrivirga marina]|uniref:TonB-dependent receptor plug domain-containing protein n=1 Tax=Rubrivirga marina TaxID=1196024 RepID=A0A271J0G7_9BACT|nr:TonB-dependent receptor plug domain-containing protein [Rubrivirga marina]PAP76992.1 hypothetical protein BSZ37_11385 [Rubrivirga marina]